jgi:hypothetical protein
MAKTDLGPGRRCSAFHADGAEPEVQRRCHGIDGLPRVSDPGFICEMSHIYVKTLQGMGVPFTPDFNRGNPSGSATRSSPSEADAGAAP